MNTLRVMMIGDIVGEPGLAVLETQLPALIKDNSINFTVVNGENAAEGFGLTDAAYRRIVAAGADVVTSGNHVWEKRDFWPLLDSEDRMLRPANYPANNGAAITPGKGWAKVEMADGLSLVVINLQGREYMNPIDCPFRCFDSIFAAECSPKPIVLVDFHAESTREKETFAYYLDGRASLVAGTHTHVQTADERVLPQGTAYITDLGMTGIIDSVIGMEPQVCLERATRQIMFRMVIAGANDTPGKPNPKAVVQGIVADIDCASGKALSIKRLPIC